MFGSDLTFHEVFGTSPVLDRLRDTYKVFRGAEGVPPTRWGVSSLKIFRPVQARALWQGRWPVRRRAVIYNLFNHTPSPISDGWSVRKSQVRDFRGGTLTYDSHNGTDFALPVGTPLVAPAPARLALVRSEFNRGGLKCVLDHGDGLLTGYAHLGRILAPVGTLLGAGQPFALSGMSGINGLVGFPLESPHLHFNVWLNGVCTDPFGFDGLPSLWKGGNEPEPAGDATPPPAAISADWDDAAIEEGIRACRSAELRMRLLALHDPEQLRAAFVHDTHYYPTTFPVAPRPFRSQAPREPRLSLPIASTLIDGIAFPDT